MRVRCPGERSTHEVAWGVRRRDAEETKKEGFAVTREALCLDDVGCPLAQRAAASICFFSAMMSSWIFEGTWR